MRELVGVSLSVALAAITVAALPATALAVDRDACKHGGWRDLTTADGTPFGNQGQCVSYVNHRGTPRPPGDVLAIAYSDLNGADGYQDASADVIIAMLVDTDDNGVDSGDRIVMGRYPLDLAASEFGDWGVTSHIVSSGDLSADPDIIEVRSDEGAYLHDWIAAPDEIYIEGAVTSSFTDGRDPLGDSIGTLPASPSRPDTALDVSRPGPDDAQFIDVDIH